MVTKHTWNTVKIANPGAEPEISPTMPQQLACLSQTFLKGKMQSKHNDKVKEGREGLIHGILATGRLSLIRKNSSHGHSDN